MSKAIKHILPLSIAVICFAGFVSLPANDVGTWKIASLDIMQDTSPHKDKAIKLVGELRKKGIYDERVLDAIGRVPRHRFVDERLSDYAYRDSPLPIGKGQTISQPYTVAFQTQLLRMKPGEKVLEIGTGSGYQAAILCEMGADVYSIERYYELHIKAKEILSELGYEPVLVFGDGYEGLPDHAPFDKILVTAAPDQLPEKLLRQLRIGGLMVVPVGDSLRQIMMVIERTAIDQFKETEHGAFLFVPMEKGTEE